MTFDAKKMNEVVVYGLYKLFVPKHISKTVTSFPKTFRKMKRIYGTKSKNKKFKRPLTRRRK
uniref:Uncharacterized protein n=1 Tax=viral metagenome TaxID=1070528 RepID=A0A6C0BRQ2_9ZZZZ